MSFLSSARKALVVLALLFCAVPAHAWQGRVVAVIDGDTMDVEPAGGGQRIRVRLHGVDAPEVRQPHGGAAKGFLIALVLFKAVHVREVPQRRDRYGRSIAVVSVES